MLMLCILLESDFIRAAIQNENEHQHNVFHDVEPKSHITKQQWGAGFFGISQRCLLNRIDAVQH